MCVRWFFVVWLWPCTCAPPGACSPSLSLSTFPTQRQTQTDSNSRSPCPYRIPSHKTHHQQKWLRRRSRRETWHIRYAHDCGLEDARETVHWTLVRYPHSGTRGTRNIVLVGLSVGSVRNTVGAASGLEAHKEKMRRRSPLMAIVRSLIGSLLGWSQR